MSITSKIETLLRPYIDIIGSDPARKGSSLKRMEALMQVTGNPHLKLRTIHIAGTSGKTSTAYYMSELLTCANQSVGLIISPHVDKVTERVQLNGCPLTDEEFLVQLKVFIGLAKNCVLVPSYFELLYGFGIWLFALLNVDYTVVETGYGGLLDATNILRRKDKLCIITDIGYDHMAALGEDIRQIAAHKAGIIHKGNTAIMYKKDQLIMPVFVKRAKTVGAKLIIVDEEEIVANEFIDQLVDFQRRNWLLAKKAFDAIADRDRLELLSKPVLFRTQSIYIPGRMDLFRLGSKQIIMDGAHNEQKLTTLLTTIANRFPNQKASIVLAVKNDKRIGNLAKALKPVAGKIYVTEFYTTRDLKVKAMPAQELTRLLRNQGLNEVVSCPDHTRAMRYALQQKDELIVVTGSFYLLSQLRQKIGQGLV